MSPLRFIATLLGGSVLAASLLACFNVAVDPYLLFDRPRAAGFNALKPAVETHEPMMKAYQAARLAPKTAILGSSRPDIGLDPASPAWPAAMRPVYNLSTVGSGLSVNLRDLRSLVASNRPGARPDTLIVGLDFESFLYRPIASAPAPAVARAETADAVDEQAERLAALKASRDRMLPPQRMLKDYAAAALTLDAVLDSLATVAANRGAGGPDLEASGRLSEGRLRQWTQSDGAAQLFAQKHQVALRQYLKPKQVLSDTPDGPIRDFSDLDALFDFAGRHAMKVVLAVQPAHASRLELLDGMGYWPDFERWKRGLAALAARARASGLDVSVWDFAGYDTFMREAVPATGDRSRPMRWFWDPVHYSTPLGDAMILTMTGGEAGFPAAVRLTPQTVDARLEQIRRDRSEFRRQAPTQLLEVQRMLCAAGRCAAASPAP